ncbi:MAG TPA: site-specific integrase [Verrucomicrobiae bacterium]|nr:site-specific integrase [Verrucomicrobiae bacterium]
MPQRPNQRVRLDVQPPEAEAEPTLWQRAWEAYYVSRAARNLSDRPGRRINPTPAQVDRVRMQYGWVVGRLSDFLADCARGADGYPPPVSGPDDWTAAHGDRFLVDLAEQTTLADSTRHTAYARIRAFLNWCAKRPDEPWARTKVVPREGEPEIVKRRQRRQPLTAAEEERIMQALRDKGRDAMLARFMLFTGARLSSALGVKRDDIDWREETVQVVLKGRTTKQLRLSLVHPDDRTFVKDLRRFIQTLPATTCPYVFLSLRRSNGEDFHGLTPSGAITLFRRLRAETGIDIHAHLFRHTYSGRMAQVVSIEDLSLSLGHSRTSTTEAYYGRRAERQSLDAIRRAGSSRPPV